MDNTKLKNENLRLKYDQDICGQELLKLVARGSAIIAEILRLKDYIPELYFNPTEEKKYTNIIFDFSYFKNVDFYEEKIMNSVDLRNLDEEFRESYLEILERFFMLFYSIFQYISDWESYVEQVKQGVFIQHTIETILMSKEIRHLLCESIFSYGVMLILVDRLIPGTIREKIIISYYRYKGQSTIQNFNLLVHMFRSTGYSLNKGEEIRPKRYPVDYFSRQKIDPEVIKLIVGVIKDNDIYDQVGAYPSAEHRSHALSNQAVILFVTLFFIPDYLELENSKMREIVDKHFSDNWVISMYMGYTGDILEYWKEFKAAKNALAITINLDTVKSLKKNFHTKLYELSEKLKKFLYEGLINEDYVLDNINILLNIMRESNVILRWLLLHRTTVTKKYRDIINENLKNSDLINLLLSTSHFEYLLKNMFQKLINNKESMWNDDKQNCMFRLKELSEYFAGNKNFGKQVKQDEFKEFFDKHYKNLEELEFANSTSAGRKIILIKESLDNIKMYYYVEGNLQIKQYINEIAQYLNHMLRIVNVKNKVLINIAQISDFSYAWIVIQEYSTVMQDFLKQDSTSVLLLRATFLKLASILNFPLVRLFEAESPDIESVTNYYSGELVKFVRNVLQIVPKSVFNLHDTVINIFTKGFQELPIKILKADLKDYAQFDDRYLLAKLTHQISLFTKGILMMEKTLMGVIEVDPKNILEDGIRKELLNLLASNFDKIINFTAGYNVDFNAKLSELTKKISCIKRSFIYIQDYINTNGSRMWHEEMHRLINYYVDLEANKFLPKKIRLDTRYDTQKYNIPRYMPLSKDTESLTFIGRMVRYIISVTKPRVAIYYPSTFTWYDVYSKEIIGIKTLNSIKQSMGVEGFQGFCRLFSYINHQQVYNFKNTYNKVISDKNIIKNLKQISTILATPCIIEYTEKDSIKNLFSVINSFSKSISTSFTPLILNLGHVEILKMLTSHCLKESVEVDSHVLNSQMENINKINMHLLKNFIEFKFKKENPTESPSANHRNSFSSHNHIPSDKEKEMKYFKLLCEMIEDFGFVDSNKTFYFNLSNLEYLVMILALVTHNEMINCFNFDRRTGLVTKKYKNDDFEFYYFIYGLLVLLYQMGRNNVIFFISFITHLMKQHLLNQYSLKDNKGMFDKNPELPLNIVLLQLFLQELANTFQIDTSMFDISLHNYLLFKSISSD
jgi:WASH complex subunit strumpellin